jgi:hypothetical protein
MRYWTTGPQDLVLCDDTFAALAESGIPAPLLPAVECGFYAALLGLCAGEAGGLTGRPNPAVMKEIAATPGLTTMQPLLPAIRNLDPGSVFETHMTILLDGIETFARKKTPATPRKRKPASPARNKIKA